MIFRQAGLQDIPEILSVRNSVKENTLTDPELVTDKDCEEYIIRRGKGWVCEIENRIVGFAIVDMIDNNVWALFVQPGFEGMGIGRRLHDDMLDWYFSQTDSGIWLRTARRTRAEHFYRNAGWKVTGAHGEGEIKFEMARHDWRQRSRG